MRRGLPAVLTVLSVLVAGVLLAAPAQAARVVVDDPAADAGGADHLDVTRAELANRGRVVEAYVTFVSNVPGDLIVSVDPRGRTGLRLVVELRPGKVRDHRGYVLRGSFSDRGAGASAVTCRDLDVRWRPARRTLRLRLPARCLHDGRYGDLRFDVLTENGSDSDIAPDPSPATLDGTRFVPRG